MNTLESYSITNPKNVTDECAKFVIDDTGSPFILSEIMQIGTRYTFSFWIKSEADSSIRTAGSTFTTTTEWQKHSIVFTATSKDLTIGFLATGTYYIYHPKLELGNMVTDWSPAPEDVDENIIESADEVRADMAEKDAETIAFCDDLMKSALVSYVKDSEYIEFKETVASEFSIRDSSIEENFTVLEGSIQEVDGKVQTEFAKLNKKISLDGDGVTVSDSNNIYEIQVDNVEGVTIRKNGEIRSQLVDDDFYTGNIHVEVNERARFGNFAFVPRSDGSLSFLKVGD